MVSQLAHFITIQARPDLSAGALGHEADARAGDLEALSLELQAAADRAKTAKDAKDVEKLRES